LHIFASRRRLLGFFPTREGSAAGGGSRGIGQGFRRRVCTEVGCRFWAVGS
jgi:hypothetical protein